MESNDTIHVALASNHRYMPGLKATLASMLLSSKHKDRIQFHIFSDGLTDADKSEIGEIVKRFGYENSIDYRIQDLTKIAERFKPYHDSYTPYLRLSFPEIFPDMKWMLWTDADIVWFRDVAELWEERDETVALVWARDLHNGQLRAASDFKKWHPGLDSSRFACSGITLMNLCRLREIGLMEKCIEFERKWGCPTYPDQDMLNEICYSETKLVDNRWGCDQPDLNWRNGIVLHCFGVGDAFANGFVGWRPTTEIWLRFYNRYVNTKKPNLRYAPFYKRMIWHVLGIIFSLPWLARLISLSMRKYTTPQALQRTMYICWLLNKEIWNLR